MWYVRVMPVVEPKEAGVNEVTAHSTQLTVGRQQQNLDGVIAHLEVEPGRDAADVRGGGQPRAVRVRVQEHLVAPYGHRDHPSPKGFLPLSSLRHIGVDATRR